jgi:hypothetical protein
MSIWDEPLTKEEYLRRLFAAKAEQRRKDAELPFEEKIEIVLALQEVSRALREAPPVEEAPRAPAVAGKAP